MDGSADGPGTPRSAARPAAAADASPAATTPR